MWTLIICVALAFVLIFIGGDLLAWEIRHAIAEKRAREWVLREQGDRPEGA